MKRSIRIRILVWGSLAIALAFGRGPSSMQAAWRAQEKKEPVPAQAKKEKEEQKKLNDQKKFDDKAAKNAEKRLKDYQKIYEFADNLYKTEPEFKLEVDAAYDAVRRSHGEYAFTINSLNKRDDRQMFTGDRVKMEDTLYDNPMVENYVNRVGQSLIPDDSKQLFTFRVSLNPIPEARSLSTGTIYISSGLLSLIDNEAQLAYILGHEIAHIKMNHWFEDALVSCGADEYNEKIAKKRNRLGRLASVAGGVFGGAGTKSVGGALQYSFLAAWGAGTALKFLMPDKVISWDERQEDQADRLALEYMFNRDYDPREVPKLYERLSALSTKDPRARMGFVGDLDRMKERLAEVGNWLEGKPTKDNQQLSQGASNLRAKRAGAGPDEQTLIVSTPQGKTFGSLKNNENRAIAAAKTLKAQEELINEKLAKGMLLIGSGEFDMLMADLKRDNGVRAFYYDMFAMAAENLTDSLTLRANDSSTHYYYGKLLHVTARDAAGRAGAIDEFRKAIELDRRNVLPEPRLYLALAMMSERNANEQPRIVQLLKDYVGIYQQMHSGGLPPNMDVIYAYMKDAQEETWSAPPFMRVSDKPFQSALQPERPRAAASPAEGELIQDPAKEPATPRLATPEPPAARPAPEPRKELPKKPEKKPAKP